MFAPQSFKELQFPVIPFPRSQTNGQATVFVFIFARFLWPDMASPRMGHPVGFS